MDFRLGGGNLPQDVLGTRQERFTQPRQSHRPPQTIKQPGSQLILEFPHLLGKRRLRKMFMLRRASEAARFGNCAKVTKLMDLHGRPPFRGRTLGSFEGQGSAGPPPEESTMRAIETIS